MECQAEAAALLPSFRELTSAGVVGRDRHGSPSDGSTDGTSSQQSQLSSTSSSDSSTEPAEIKELRLSSAHAMLFLSQQKRDSTPDMTVPETLPTCLQSDAETHHLMLVHLQDSPHGFYIAFHMLFIRKISHYHYYYYFYWH